MNVYDGERMAELLGAQRHDRGRATARTPTWSCSTPATSARRRPRRPIRTSAGCGARTARKPLIALAGCVAQAEGAEAKAPLDDDRHGRRPAGLSPPAGNGRRGRARARARSTPTCRRSAKFDALPARRRAGPSAFLTVQEGCDKFCTYCVVPYTRGAEISPAVGRHRRRGAGAGRRRRARDRPARPERQRLGATATAASPS